METTSHVKELLRKAWPMLYLSEAAALLSCNFGTAYRCLEEAGCFPPARAGKPSQKIIEILSKFPNITNAIEKREITPRRYFNCIQRDIEMLETDPNNYLLNNNLKHDFPEIYGEPPIYFNKKDIRLNYKFSRSKNGGHVCYSQDYRGILGRGKSASSALYYANVCFKKVSHKGRLELFFNGGVEAALQWEPTKITDKQPFVKPVIVEDKPLQQPRRTVADMKVEHRNLMDEFSKTPNNVEGNKKKIEIKNKIENLVDQIKQIEDPKLFELEQESRRCKALVENMRGKLHKASCADNELYIKLEFQNRAIEAESAEAEQKLKEYRATLSR